MNKDMKKLLAKIEAQGGSWRLTSNRHVQVRDRDNRVVSTASGTPSDVRAWKNMIAELRRAGFDV